MRTIKIVSLSEMKKQQQLKNVFFENLILTYGIPNATIKDQSTELMVTLQ